MDGYSNMNGRHARDVRGRLESCVQINTQIGFSFKGYLRGWENEPVEYFSLINILKLKLIFFSKSREFGLIPTLIFKGLLP